MRSRLREAAVLWVQGGLGNQLFQLNAGLETTSENGCALILSRSSYGRDALRDFELAQLLPPGVLASRFEEMEIGQPYSWRGKKKRGSLLHHVQYVFGDDVLLADTFCPGSVNIGFFQSPEFLGLPTTKTRALLTDASRLPEWIVDLVRGRPVMHVRRGDYASSPSARRSFGILGRDYYQAGCEALGIDLHDAVVFTDEPHSVAAEFGLSPAQIIGPDTLPSPLQNIIAMSLASDLLIPNSTFSWWAAEIAGHGRVVAPSTWFLDREGAPQRATWTLVANR